MSFDNPAGLWLLALGVPILAFHFYKGRLRHMAVPMLLFWEQVIVEEERKTALRKLRYWASLLLNLAALAVLTSAVAGPNVKGLTRQKARIAVILDNSPGMGAMEPDGRTRAQAAVDRAREFMLSLGYGDRVSVSDLGGARVPFTAELRDLARRLPVPRPSPGKGLRERVTGALAAGEDVTAVLFTDRPPAGVDDYLASGRLRVARVGTARENAGWVAGQAIRTPGDKRVTLSLRAAAFAPGNLSRQEVLYLNGKELQRRPLELEPEKTAEREWSLDPARFPGAKLEEGGLVEVALEPADALSSDDVASFVLPPLVPPQIFVVHPGKPSELLMHALETLRIGGVISQDLGLAPASQAVAIREGWIVVYDRVAPRALPERGAYLILGAPGPAMVEKPVIADWDRDAPPNRGVDYGGLLVQRSRILAGTPLLQAVEGPVATWVSRGGRAGVELGFTLEESDIAARPAFLLMLLNFVEWAGQRGLRAFRSEVRVGEPLRPDRALWIEEGELTFARGDRVERSRVRQGMPEKAPPAEPGFVRASAAGRTEWVAVNLFDVGESDLREPPAEPAGAPPPPPAPWHARLPWAAVAVVIVLTLLLLEWGLYHRALI